MGAFFVEKPMELTKEYKGQEYVLMKYPDEITRVSHFKDTRKKYLYWPSEYLRKTIVSYINCTTYVEAENIARKYKNLQAAIGVRELTYLESVTHYEGWECPFFERLPESLQMAHRSVRQQPVICPHCVAEIERLKAL